MAYPDIQAGPADGSFRLTRVGVTGVKKPVRIKRAGTAGTLVPTMNAFVDLPATQRGSHMSRNVEIINDIVDESVREPVSGLEVLCGAIARRLLERHEYATYAEVSMGADYFLEREAPSKKRSLESYKIVAKAKAERVDGIPVTKLIGVVVQGMTACPCAMETAREILVEKHPEAKKLLKKIPTITHNQRNISTLMVEVPEKYDVEANDLIDIVEDSVSSPTFELLKRGDEGEIVMRAHQNPKFVEDVVRDILRKMLDRYKAFPDDTLVTVRSEAEESIHKHNAFAERSTTLGELRRSA